MSSRSTQVFPFRPVNMADHCFCHIAHPGTCLAAWWSAGPGELYGAVLGRPRPANSTLGSLSG
eukprot:10159425-Lingulodinium_polyedra.AAC.1